MSKVYYANATGPVTANINGRVYRLTPGESLGPLSESDYQQILMSSDKSRLNFVAVDATKVEAAAPKTKEVDELYAGVSTTTLPSKPPELQSQTYASEPVELDPKPSYGNASFKIEESEFKPKLVEPEVELPTSSSATPLTGANTKPEEAAREPIEHNPDSTPRRTRKAKQQQEKQAEE